MSAALTPAVTRLAEILVALSRSATDAFYADNYGVTMGHLEAMQPLHEELAEIVGALGRYLTAQEDDVRGLLEQGYADARMITALSVQVATYERERALLFDKLFNALGHVSECYRTVSKPPAVAASSSYLITAHTPRTVAAGSNVS
jgi:hypothetical protein